MALWGVPVDELRRGELHHVSIGAGAGVQMETHHDSSVSRPRHLVVTARLQYCGRIVGSTDDMTVRTTMCEPAHALSS